MNVLFLDDDLTRQAYFRREIPSAYVVATARDCIFALSERNWHIVCLDHDLGGEVFVDSGREDTGMEVVRYIRENRPLIDIIYCHSYNQPARSRMVDSLFEMGYTVVDMPFGPRLIELVRKTVQ